MPWHDPTHLPVGCRATPWRTFIRPAGVLFNLYWENNDGNAEFEKSLLNRKDGVVMQ